MDKITICDLEVFYRVGVPDEERAKPQRLLVSVELELDFSKAATGDDLAATIDYEAVAQRLVAFGAGRSWKLIETLAVDVAEMVLAEFRPQAVSVDVKKFILPGAKFVSASVRRGWRGAA